MENITTLPPPDRYDYDYEEELILKKLLVKLNKLWHILWINKSWILLGAIVLAALASIKTVLSNPTYEATISFMVEEEEAGSIGNIASILGQFGLGGAAGGEQNLEKITTLAASRKIMHQVLLEKLEVDGKIDFVANHIINIYELRKKWEKDTLLNELSFIHNDFYSFNKKEKAGLKKIFNLVVGNDKQSLQGIMKTGFAKETGILFITIIAINESLAIQLTKSIYNNLSVFYIEESIENPKQTFEILTQRTDSLLTALTSTQKKLAYLEAKSGERVTHDDRILKKILFRDLQVQTIMYGEVLKTKETSGFLLSSETPFFQVIDEPFSPIAPDKPSLLLAIIIGSCLGGFLTAAFSVSRTIYKGMT